MFKNQDKFKITKVPSCSPSTFHGQAQYMHLTVSAGLYNFANAHKYNSAVQV